MWEFFYTTLITPRILFFSSVRWSQIAHHLPGRSDNEIKNYWHSCLKKRVEKMAETTRVGEIRGQEVWSSYIKSTPESSSSPESLDHRKGSVLERDQRMQQIGAQKLSLPKVLFAEWLSFDQFYNQNNVENHSSIHEGTLVDGLLPNGGGSFGVETNPKCSQVYMDDMLHSDDQFDYFPGELCINYDELNVHQFQ